MSERGRTPIQRGDGALQPGCVVGILTFTLRKMHSFWRLEHMSYIMKLSFSWRQTVEQETMVREAS